MCSRGARSAPEACFPSPRCARGTARRAAHLGLGASSCEDAAPSGAPSRRLKPRAALFRRPSPASIPACSRRAVMALLQARFRRRRDSRSTSSARPKTLPPGGVPGLPGAWLRTMPAGAAPHPVDQTPLEDAPRWVGMRRISSIEMRMSRFIFLLMSRRLAKAANNFTRQDQGVRSPVDASWLAPTPLAGRDPAKVHEELSLLLLAPAVLFREAPKNPSGIFVDIITFLHAPSAPLSDSMRTPASPRFEANARRLYAARSARRP